MEPVTTHPIIAIIKALMGLFAPLAVSEAPITAGILPITMKAATETLILSDEVDFEIVTDINGNQVVMGRFSEIDTAAFGEFTGRHINETVSFVLCGEVLLAPRLLERLDSGRFAISGAGETQKFIEFMANGCP